MNNAFFPDATWDSTSVLHVLEKIYQLFATLPLGRLLIERITLHGLCLSTSELVL